MEGTVAGATLHVDPAPQDCLGATMALPLLESMVPAATAYAKTTAARAASRSARR